MWVEVNDLDLVSLGTPLPKQEFMFELPCDDGLQAVSCLICKDRVCGVEPEVQPGITIAIDMVSALRLDGIGSDNYRSLFSDNLLHLQIDILEQLPVNGV